MACEMGSYFSRALEASQKRHEEGDVVLTAESAQALRKLHPEAVGELYAALTLDRGSRPIGGQIEHRERAGEAVPPPGELRGAAPASTSTSSSVPSTSAITPRSREGWPPHVNPAPLFPTAPGTFPWGG